MPATDFYGQCETGLRNILLDLTTYFEHDWQIMNGDESGLTKGAQYFARLHPNSFSDTDVASQQAFVDWEIALKIYVRFGEMQASWDAFRALRAEVVWKILQYPTLNNVSGVDSTRVGAGDLPVYIVEDPEVSEPTPLFISQTLIVTVHQRIVITGGEYA